MSDLPIRMRIAPSPTGEPHIGTAYTALFNLLMAQKLGGEMILRIEDTDLSRSSLEAEEKLIAALNWLGFSWAEGPDKGGPYGPYRQSERKLLYKPYVDRLIRDGHAFRCYCTKERLEEMRQKQRIKEKQTKYDGFCLKRTPHDLAALDDAGVPFVVRMKIPDDGECVFVDGVYGKVSIPYDAVDMQVILKVDEMPTYHLANVVDDHLMRITHVARGEEWLSSVPKHLLLYEYFGWQSPAWYHLPLMRNADRSKLSKRHNATSLSYFPSIGYLPEALINFLGLFFVDVVEGEELMDFSQLVEKFNATKPSKAGAVFDIAKLDWLNGRWIRERVRPEEFTKIVTDWVTQDNRLDLTLELARARINVLGDLPELINFVFTNDLGLTRHDFDETRISAEECYKILNAVLQAVDTLPSWNRDAIRVELQNIASQMGLKLRSIVPPLFIALTGNAHSLPIFDSMVILGRSIVRHRLSKSLALLR